MWLTVVCRDVLSGFLVSLEVLLPQIVGILSDVGGGGGRNSWETEKRPVWGSCTGRAQPRSGHHLECPQGQE